MTIEELKQRVEAQRARCQASSGKSVMFSENGPVGLPLIDALIGFIESQDKRIDELERQAANDR